MCVYVYICILCKYVYICIYIYICVYDIYVYMYVCVYIYVYIYECIYVDGPGGCSPCFSSIFIPPIYVMIGGAQVLLIL